MSTKRTFALLLALCMLAAALAGCAPATEPQVDEPVAAPDAAQANTPDASPAAEPNPKPAPTADPAPASAVKAELLPDPEPKTCNITVSGAELPQTKFAEEEIMAAGREYGVENPWNVVFAGIDDILTEQAYVVTVEGNTITIKGGDAAGLMYGGLEVAEQIALYGAEGVKAASAAPYVLRRGYITNVPLDMRSPCYSTPGTSAQDNIAAMWNIEYWHELFDNMARNRCNIFYMNNINPYPSMVKVDGYEDCALDDVWRSTIPYDDTIKGDMTNVVRDEDWENYEVLKTMTIDEKIAFWREVMAYAKDRSIQFGIRQNNIYTYSENGKYGITDSKDNPVTTDYFYKSCKALLETYPDLTSMNIASGENMGWSNGSDKGADYEWLYNAYGRAIKEVLENDPDRKFDLILPGRYELLSQIGCDIIYSASYTGTHMYACATPQLAAEKLAADDGRLYAFSCRNEDVFNMRWGDPDFMRAFVKNMPGQDKLYRYLTGSDGYCYAYDYSFEDTDLDGQLYVDKHWFNYYLMFRFLFEPDLSDERIADAFSRHYRNEPESDTLLEATSTAGKIIPMVNRSFYMSNSDYTWFVEGCWSHPSTGGYINIKQWMKGDTTYTDGETMSIEEYAVALANGEEPEALGRMLPTEVAENLKAFAEETLAKTAAIRAANPKGDKLTFAQKEYWQQLEDDEAMAYLGLFYSEKILGAIDLRIFNDTKDESYRESSVAHLEKSAEYFEKYAEIISSNYAPQRLSRVGYFDVNAIAESVRGDIEIVKTWKPRTIRPSYRPPAKNDYFASGTENKDDASAEDQDGG